MASTIYNHRSLQPTGPPAQGQNPQQQQQQQQQHVLARLNESFDSIKQEFDGLTSELSHSRSLRDDYESKLNLQISELTIIRQYLHELESQHAKIREQYEDELTRLRTELHAARHGQAPPSSTVVGPGGAPGAGAALGLNLGIAPTAAQSSSIPGIPSGAGSSSYADPYYRERDRDRERGGDRLPDRDRDRERAADSRDTKRLKTERMKGASDRPDHNSPNLGPGLNPKLPPVPGSTSAGAGGPGLPSAPPSSSGHPYGAAGPTSAVSAPADRDRDRDPSAANNLTNPPSNALTTTPRGVSSSALVPASNGAAQFPDDLDPHNVPPELKKEGSDWFAVFNPKVKRVLDVSLVHTLMHESVVCCVRFSADGKYLATGCNRTAQIYDTKTGAKTCVLVDESAGKAGDLYIRSVCFSPDGKFLATGAEDKQIRIWDIAKQRIRTVFDGHQQEIYSLDFSLDGNLIVSGSGDKTARIWDMRDGSSKVLTINDPDSAGSDAGVTSVAISPNGQLVAAGSLDTVVRIWDVNTGALVERLRGHRDSVYSVAFTPDGKGLVSGSLDKALKYWDVSGLVVGGIKGRKESASLTGGPGVVGSVNGKKEGEKGSQCTMNFTGHKDYVLSVAVSHDGQWVVSGSKDRSVQFWDSRTATVQCMLQGHKNSVISIDLSPAGSILATGSGDWQARIWSYTTT